MVYVHVDRGALGAGDSPKFQMIKLDDASTLDDLIRRYLESPGLPVAEEGVVWALTGGGITFAGTTDAPRLSGPGGEELAHYHYGAHPEHERSVHEVADGALLTRLLDLPIVNEHRVAALWWAPEPAAAGQ